MRNVVILTSVLAVLGAGSAMAQNFKPSEPNSGPETFRSQVVAPVDRTITTSSVGATGNVGFSAADGFGPSDESNQPAPRFQTNYGANEIVPSGTGVTTKTYNGYNASDSFEPS